MIYDINEMVEVFAGRRHVSYKKSTVNHLFGLSGDKPYSFLSQYQQETLLETERKPVADLIASAIKGSIRNYPSGKKTAIELYKAFVGFLSDKYELSVNVDFPAVAIWDPLERQLAIIKMLHERNISTVEMADRLFVSDRTIEDDLKMIRESDTEALQLMGQPVKIPYTRRSRHFTSESTAHPVFLMANLAQVITMLEGLGKQAQLKEYERFALLSAVNIWSELSDYARERINRLSDTLALDRVWLRKIQRMSEEGVSNLFQTERECSDVDTVMSLIMIHKSGEKCFIEYKDESGQIAFLKSVQIVSIKMTEFEYRSETIKGTLKKDQVLRITTNPIELAN